MLGRRTLKRRKTSVAKPDRSTAREYYLLFSSEPFLIFANVNQNMRIDQYLYFKSMDLRKTVRNRLYSEDQIKHTLRPLRHWEKDEGLEAQ